MKGIWIFLIIIINGACFAQAKYDANWCFGYNAGIDFSDTANIRTFTSLTNDFEPASTISDANGHLLFYTANNDSVNGVNYYGIRDSNKQYISNCEGCLTTNPSSTNGFLIVPFQNNPYKWFVFEHLEHLSPPFASFGYITVEKYGIPFLASDSTKELLSHQIEEKIAYVKHANGKDGWLLVHQSYEDSAHSTAMFYRYLIHNDSVLGPFAQNIGFHHDFTYVAGGEMTFSRQGNLLALTEGGENIVELFHFDRCTGLLSNNTLISLSRVGDVYSCEFSPDETKLYVVVTITDDPNNIGHNQLFQFNLLDSNILASKTTIFTDTFPANIPYNFGQLQIAPNNKIYLSVSSYGGGTGLANRDIYNNYLSVINNPDSLGTACDFQMFSFYLGDSSYGTYGLPNMPNYNLEPLPIYKADAGHDTTICKNSNMGVILGTPSVANLVYHWFPITRLSNAAVAQPFATPDSDTYYILTVTDTTYHGNSCSSRHDTVWIHVVGCDTTGIDNATPNGIHIYPNPATEQLVVENQINNSKFQMGLVLYDLMGRTVLIKHLTDPKTLIDISNLPNGLYIYKLGSQTGKVLISH